MATLTVISQETEDDKEWGYKFGVDGLLGSDDVIRLLGGVSRVTLDRRVAENKLRRGKEGGRMVFCERSVRNYIASCAEKK